MSVPLLAAALGLALSLLARRRRPRARLSLDDIALALVAHAGIVAVAATVLAAIDHFSAIALALVCAAAALACWPWRLRRSPAPALERPTSLIHTLALLAVVALGVGLRLPTIPAPLAGRDQGSYVLRAELTLRTGSLDWRDELLAEAGRRRAEDPDDPAGHDLLGLYPGTDKAWRAGHYEAAYRPGAYLAERESGRVVAQFFHLHPMLLAATGATFGAERLHWALPWTSFLWLLTLACCARRLWPRGPWAALAVAIVACSPLAIWTGRTPLSETPHAMFEWAAVLACLHLRPLGEGPGERSSWLAATMLAFAAGVRGNALLTLPVILALLWLRPRPPNAGGQARAPWIVLAGLVASVLLHAYTSYPYMHDELLRRGPELALGPLSLSLIALLGAGAWLLVDRELDRLASIRDRLRAVAPKLLALALLAAFVIWWHLKSGAEQPRPFSRLDAAPPLFGLPLLAAAGLGAVVVARRWRPAPGWAGRRDAWLLALAAAVPITALLYAPRELPNLSFFYYGRYLVPELLPCAALLAVALLERVHRRLAGDAPGRLRKLAAAGAVAIAAAGLLWSVAGPLLTAPQLRLREFAAAERAVDWLATRLPEDAVVIAGGEGWHHGHTHNQVGGALAMGEGVQVLPYRTREDAWVSAWDLLVDTPQDGRDASPRALYLLVNEAAHNYTRADGARVALLDDLLWAPFVIEEISLVELFVHALSPANGEALPTRVARHELRMGLLKLRVDPSRLATVERLRLDDREDRPAGIVVRGGLHDDGRACLSPDRSLHIELPASEARHLAIVAAGLGDSQLAGRMARARVRVAGEALAVDAPKGLRARHRATLGPLPLPAGLDAGPWTLELRAPEVPEQERAPGDCPWGRVAELRLLPRERGSSVAELPVEARSFAPADDLGHPIQPALWVRGRSLSRYRPGTRPTPKVRGVAMELEAGASLRFAPIDLPLDAEARPHALELLVTLARTETPAGARLRVRAEGELLAEIEVPAERPGSWIAAPIPWAPTRDRAELELELEAEGGRVLLRDLAAFVVDAELARSELETVD